MDCALLSVALCWLRACGLTLASTSRAMARSPLVPKVIVRTMRISQRSALRLVSALALCRVVGSFLVLMVVVAIVRLGAKIQGLDIARYRDAEAFGGEVRGGVHKKVR